MNLVHFFHFLTLHFWDHFWPFLTLYCASDWAHGPHLDHHLEVYYLSVESPKKWTLIIDSVQFFDVFSFMVIFSHFGSLGGSLRAPSHSWGLLRAPKRCLISMATLTPCLVQPPVQLGKFADFWGLPTTHSEKVHQVHYPLRKSPISSLSTDRRAIGPTFLDSSHNF